MNKLLRRILKKNPFTLKLAYSVLNVWHFIQYLWINGKAKISAALRRRNVIEFKAYSRIRSFKGVHNGERCFIVLTGPSLHMQDVERLKNETCIGVNSILQLLDRTNWRPTYYAFWGADKGFNKILEDMGEQFSAIFYCNTYRKNMSIRFDENVYCFPWLNEARKINERFTLKESEYRFSDDIYVGIATGASIAGVALQIAVYMGFKEIYLLGADCDFGGAVTHFEGGDYYKKISEEGVKIASESVLIGYRAAKKYADEHDIKICNATRGGKLEVFERVDLDEILKQTSAEVDT